MEIKTLRKIIKETLLNSSLDDISTLNEAIKTPCQTKDAIYKTKITNNLIDIKVELPFTLDIDKKEAKILEANLHNVIEIVLSKYFKK